MEESRPTTSLSAVPVPRLIGMVLGLAVSIAIAYGVLQWATAPGYSFLYTGLETPDTGEVVAALRAEGISYKLDGATGMIMVESDRVHEARLKLASRDLPRGGDSATGILEEKLDSGTSQLVETARYHHALETELARTISSMRNIRSARVHLAIPEHSAFTGERTAPSASVVLNLYGGQGIDRGQINSIVQLLASSISRMKAENVTVVDHVGRMLSSGDMNSDAGMTARHYEYEYARELEQDYAQRIERLLEPIIGAGKVRATVKADLEFSSEVSTGESLKPVNTAVRSKRFSVAVLVDDRLKGEGGNLERTPLTDKDIQNITTLVKQTIGYDEQRGDVVNVINASFTQANQLESQPQSWILEQPWLRDLGKQLLAAGIILLLIWKVIIPVVRNLSEYTPPPPVLPSSAENQVAGSMASGQAQLHYQQGDTPLPSDHEEKVEFARSMVDQDARRVANVVKNWMNNEV